MPRHTKISTLQEVGQTLSDAVDLANFVDSTAQTFGANLKTRQGLKQMAIFGALLAGGIYLITRKK